MADINVNLELWDLEEDIWVPWGSKTVDDDDKAAKVLIYGESAGTPKVLKVDSTGQLVSSPVSRTVYNAKTDATGLVLGALFSLGIVDALSYTRLVGDMGADQPFLLYINQDETSPLVEATLKQSVIQCFQETIVASTAQNQVETATAAGTITGSGDLSVTVTAAGMTGSPVVVAVPVINTDTASVWAGKVRTVLAANAQIAAFLSIGGTTTGIVATTRTPAANDGTLNIAIAAGTAANASLPLATSANTTAGVAGTSTRWGASFDIALTKRYLQLYIGVSTIPSAISFGGYLGTVVR